MSTVVQSEWDGWIVLTESLTEFKWNWNGRARYIQRVLSTYEVTKSNLRWLSSWRRMLERVMRVEEVGWRGQKVTTL